MNSNFLVICRIILLLCLFNSICIEMMAYAHTELELQDTIEIGNPLNISQRNSAASISSISGQELYKVKGTNIVKSLKGRIPGLTITEKADGPVRRSSYGNQVDINVRGLGTYGIANNNKLLIFIDGFEVGIETFLSLTSTEIEKVSVFKDATTLSTFGMEASEGVLWVTTKRGFQGEPEISFNFHSGIYKPEILNKPLGSYEYANLFNQAISNDSDNQWSPRYSTSEIEDYKNNSSINVDWFDEVLKPTSTSNQGDLSLRGGNNTAQYSVILNYLQHNGLYDVQNTDSTSNESLNRYSLRTNLDLKFLKIFESKISLSAKLSNFRGPNYSRAALWSDLSQYPSNIYNVKDSEDNWSGTAVYPNNPLASIQSLGWRNENFRDVVANFELIQRLDFITQGLFLSESVSLNSYGASVYSKVASYARYNNGETTTIDKDIPIRAERPKPDGQIDRKQLRVSAGYENNYGNHYINLIASYYQSSFKGDDLLVISMRKKNINSRINYNYKGRYIGEIGFSYFGSDYFHPDNNWGFYPSISGAWIISEEENFNSSSINFLKIRASVGKVGGINTSAYSSGRYLYQQYYHSPATTFFTGMTSPIQTSPLEPKYYANSGVLPEKSMKYNLGIDLNSFNGFTINLDGFLDKRSNILARDNSIPSYYGNIEYYSNTGAVTNYGFDGEVKYLGSMNKLNYSVFAMATYYKNKIDKIPEVTPPYGYNSVVAHPIGSHFGLISDGFFDVDDFNTSGELRDDLAVPSFGAVQAGDVKYKDLNNDGIIDEKDFTIIGNPSYPKLSYSFGVNFNFNNIDLGLILTGVNGVDINVLNQARIQTEAFVNNGNVYSIAQNAWAYYPEEGIDTRSSATYPRLTTVANPNNYRNSSFWIKSGSYIKLHNIELGYSLSPTSLKRTGLKQLRFFVNSINPLTISSLSSKYNIDPETLSGYPLMTSINLGFSLTY